VSYVEGGDTPKEKSERSTFDEDSLIARCNKWDSALDAHWGEWRTEARTCFGMVAGHQIDERTREDAESKGIAYVVLNKIDATISAICGSEIQGRQEVRYYPREMSDRGPDGQLIDTKVNEILTGAAEWVRDECDASEEESQAFRDCVICGLGWTETRMDYEEDPEGMPKIERVDPLEMAIDPASRRPNAVDARYLRRKKRFPRDEAAERFGIDPNVLPAQGVSTPEGSHENYPGSAYQDKGGDDEAPIGKDQVEVDEYQWFDVVKGHAVADPKTGQVTVFSAEQFAKLKASGLAPQSTPAKKRRYRRALRIATQMLEVSELQDEEFTYKAVTGKLDRNKGTWYGVVRAMIDPQRLMNKMVSQVQRIIDTNAKGGLLAETDAFEDQQQAEEEWAGSDTIVWAKSGSLGRNPKVMPKPIAPYPAAIDKLFAVMDEAVPGVSGVNKEMLGVVERDQAGILDTQRKQAAYSVLAGFFDSLRRYRKQQGRLLLKLIAKYMSDGRLIRIVGRQGNVQYAQLAKQPETLKYDVIVDEAPAGPNQKERTFAFLQSPLGAKVMEMAPPPIQLKMLEYSPLPTSLVAEIQKIAEEMPDQPDPEQQKMQGELQMQAQRMQADAAAQQQTLKLKTEEAQANFALKQQESAANLQQKREEAALNLQLMREKAAEERQIAMDKIEGEREIALIRIENEREIALLQLAAEAELEDKKIESQERIGKHKASMSASVKVNGADSEFSANRPGGSLSE